MIYSNTGTLSPETQPAIEQEMRVLLRIMKIFFYVYLHFHLLKLKKYTIFLNRYFKMINAVGPCSPEMSLHKIKRIGAPLQQCIKYVSKELCS